MLIEIPWSQYIAFYYPEPQLNRVWISLSWIYYYQMESYIINHRFECLKEHVPSLGGLGSCQPWKISIGRNLPLVSVDAHSRQERIVRNADTATSCKPL